MEDFLFHNNTDKNFFKNARYIGAWLNFFNYLNEICEYKFDREIKNYILQKQDIYIPDYTVGVGYSFRGLKVDFPGINKQKLAKILTATENIFNTKIGTIAFSPTDFEIN